MPGILRIAVFGLLLSPAMPVHAQALSAEKKAELIHLLKQDCGSCHGMTLQGGLGPSLLPKDMAAKPREVLRQIILDGVPGTPMPPWRPLLTEAEVDWLVEILQKGVPNAP